jgi:rhamnogalacturonan acetylesterase
MVSALMWRFVLAVSLSLATWLTAAERKPVVWLIGDSTVQNRNAGLLGWGTPFAQAVDLNQVEVQNKAIGGRSSRTYYRDHWPEVRKALRPGDWLLVQFGHNDGGSLQRSTRASLKGCSEKTEEWADPKTGRKETVHTFGWYLRQFGNDAKAAGVHVVFLSLIARNIWKDDKVVRAAEQYGRWAKESAATCGADFIDLNDLVATAFEKIGSARVKAELFKEDHTHTTPAVLCAGLVSDALRARGVAWVARDPAALPK